MPKPNRMYFRDNRGVKITLATQDNQYGITVGVAINHPEDPGSKTGGYEVAQERLLGGYSRTLSREKFFEMVEELRLVELGKEISSYKDLHRQYLRILSHYRVV